MAEKHPEQESTHNKCVPCSSFMTWQEEELSGIGLVPSSFNNVHRSFGGLSAGIGNGGEGAGIKKHNL